jgi:hypothetical protein
MNFNNLIGVILVSFFFKGEGLEAACSCDFAVIQEAPSNDNLL